MSAYLKRYDGQIKWMYFWIEDDYYYYYYQFILFWHKKKT